MTTTGECLVKEGEGGVGLGYGGKFVSATEGVFGFCEVGVVG